MSVKYFLGRSRKSLFNIQQLIQQLIPDLLEYRWAVVHIYYLYDDGGAGFHSSHAQGTHHQKVRCCLLAKQRNPVKLFKKLIQFRSDVKPAFFCIKKNVTVALKIML